MKTSKAITLVMMALALSAVPALAQSPTRGGGRSGGSVSSSPSRSSGSFSSPSRSSGSSFSGSRSTSSPSRSSSYSSPSRSHSYSSPSRSNNSYSSPSRSNSSMSRGNSYSSPSRSTTSPTRSTEIPSSARRAGTIGSGSGAPSPSGSPTRSGVRAGTTPAGTVASPTRSTAGGSVNMPSNSNGAIASPTRSGSPAAPAPGTSYARPGRPGGYMPPAARPIHPAPYFYHPWHRHMVHCHPIFWDPLPPRPWYWPGFWLYCNSYWYDYHVTDVVVVRRYVQDTYNVDMVTYGISGDIMYAIVRDGGETYLQVYDKNDHLLAEQKINRKYCNMVIDSENGGCWISKKHDKDPLLFIWADGQLLIYEAD